jgi:uracil-DNA glycosylase
MADIILKDIPIAWDIILKRQDMYELLDSIAKKLPSENLSPPIHQILNTLKYINNLNEITAIIIGQDPYINVGEAHGLSFSVPIGVKIPPSLLNIYSALSGPIHNGNLEYWAAQGVILLNASLTTIIGKSNAHCDLWQVYTDKLLAGILDIKSDIALILWGDFAKKKKVFKRANTHVLEWRHPSPMSNNPAPEQLKFKNCDNFCRLNELLLAANKPPIDWQCGTLQRIVIFTDGAASANGSNNCNAGWGVYVPAKPFYLPTGRQNQFIGHDKEIHLSGPVMTCNEGPATNNRAELGAILKGLLWLLDNTTPPLLVTIVSDSQYSIGMISDWGPKRILDGSLGEKKNCELVTLIINIMEICKTKKYIIDFHHMRGHGKDKNVCKAYLDANEIVDRLATGGKI